MSPTGDSVEEIGRRFVDAFNRRDAEELVALCDPEVDFHPTPLVGRGQHYSGHDGLRRWMSELVESGADYRVRVREVRALDDDRFVVLSEVLLGDERITPSAMVAQLGEDDRIVESRSYLSDEQVLRELGVLEPRSTATD
jgi:hypothetical protein